MTIVMLRKTMLYVFVCCSLLLGLAVRPAAAQRVYVFLTHGTWGGASEWTRLVDGHATFASELIRALPEGSQIQPLFYRGTNTHEARVDAAKELAERIDAEDTDGYRICLIGHSHGGNVCLRAAGLCSKPIETVICLSTPHCYTKHQQFETGGLLRLPVYCSTKTLTNCRQLVSVTSKADLVPSFYARLDSGVSDNEALFSNEDWQRRFDFPGLRYDGLLADLFGLSNVDVMPSLSIPEPGRNDVNVTLFSASDDPLGLEPHHQIHSRRTGYVLGIVMRERCSPLSLAYLQSTIHPPDADDGSPVSLLSHRSWLRENAEKLSFSGWVLRSLDVTLVPEARFVADDFDRSLPDPVAVIHDGGEFIVQSQIEVDVAQATLDVGGFFPVGRRRRLDVRDQDIFTSYSLGAVEIDGGDQVPTRILPAPEVGRYWGAELRWQWVHY